MADRIQLEVITPERSVLRETVDSVTVPGLNGELGILPGHTPLISHLRTGILSYTDGGTTERLHVSGGFVEVNNDRVTVLADIAERSTEIDVERARRARERAERALSSSSTAETEMESAQSDLERATVRLQLAAGSVDNR